MERTEAIGLLGKNLSNKNLIKHSLAVEAAMIAYACKFGMDQKEWGICGLLHDVDYEKFPEPSEHGRHAREILGGQVSEDVVLAIEGHNEQLGNPRESRLAKTLFAVDELTGLIVACALILPSKKLSDVSVDFIKNRWKQSSFARNVSRENIEKGAQELGVDLNEHIKIVLSAMQGVSSDLGL